MAVVYSFQTGDSHLSSGSLSEVKLFSSYAKLVKYVKIMAIEGEIELKMGDQDEFDDLPTAKKAQYLTKYLKDNDNILRGDANYMQNLFEYCLCSEIDLDVF